MTAHLLQPPETAISEDVRSLLAGCDPVVLAHSERSYQFAAAFALTDQADVDEEVLYLGTILHDVGLSPAAQGMERFEVRGANLVRELLLDNGMSPDRAANVWDVIAMHASTPLARHKSTETRYANRGIAVDVRAANVEMLTPGFVRAVLDQWPRDGFPAAFEMLLAAEVRANPDSARMSWLESVAAVHVPDFEPAQFLTGLRSSEGFV